MVKLKVFGDYLRRKARNAAIRASEEDLGNFLKSIRAVDKSEITMLAAMAGFSRLIIESQFDEDPPKTMEHLLRYGADPGLQLDLQLLVKKTTAVFQEFDLPIAAGTMVWLHTCRAYTYPELRGLCQKMWVELSRAADDLSSVRSSLLTVVSMNEGPAKKLESRGVEINSEANLLKCITVPSGMEKQQAI